MIPLLAISPKAVEEAVLTVPDVAPFPPAAIVVRTVPPPEGVGPIIVMFGLVLNCDSVIFDPATNAQALDEAVFAVPDVAPPAAEVIVLRTVPTVFVATP